MFFHKVVINENVVYVNNYKITKPLSKNVVHECAKCDKCIGESKRHHQKLIQAKPCVANNIFFIPFYNSNLVIFRMQVNPIENLNS